MGSRINRPDIAVYTLFGFCLACFLLVIGSILTFNLTFNSYSDDQHKQHPHSPQQFHHYPISSIQVENQQNHVEKKQPSQENGGQEKKMSPSSSQGSNNKQAGGESQSGQSPLLQEKNSQQQQRGNSSHNGNETPGGSSFADFPHVMEPQTEANENKIIVNSSSSHNGSSSNSDGALTPRGTRNNKGSVVLAVIGPSCLLMGFLLIVIIVVVALKYDCDHEPEPEIAFLRLRSELSLNFDPDKNNYELLRRVPTTSQGDQQQSSGTSRTNPA
ncbi:uncharacterized protein LOC110848930 [Folsomia candida]|uniref:Uncharacterized protein n=1 Tax=Folsomia candida TaxID=158441 RepID=A0A226EEY7_FOLCA|nr:uncharacterized protein LOC110848930 [Folsomia candida]OXA56135.1 hypothetical protein Fcan01_09259 [Folsomia candida]